MTKLNLIGMRKLQQLPSPVRSITGQELQRLMSESEKSFAQMSYDERCLVLTMIEGRGDRGLMAFIRLLAERNPAV